MPAERAGYTVTMFVVDTSPTMGELRVVDLPDGPDCEKRTAEITNLEWGLRYVKTKIQEMIFNGRKTDQCGVIVFGSETTNNIVNDQQNEGYEQVEEYIPIAQPNAGTLAKLDALEASSVTGDPIDALIVAVETQNQHLGKKKTWTRKVVLLTDGRSDIETEDWEATVDKMVSLDVKLTIVGIDFDDPDWGAGYVEENKPSTKAQNESFYRNLVTYMNKRSEGSAVVGTCGFALEEVARPDTRQRKSQLKGTVLYIGSADWDPEQAIEISVKMCKATALERPVSMKKYALRVKEHRGEDEDEMDVDQEEEGEWDTYMQLKMRSEYWANTEKREEDASQMEEEEEEKENLAQFEREELVRGYKYGSTYVPVPEEFPKLETAKGLTICGFFHEENFRRELSMGEVYYVWADPHSPFQQTALSSLARAMDREKKLAIARWVQEDMRDVKMGVLKACCFDTVDSLLWVRMPFADDVRKYTFASLDRLVNKKGEEVKEHPYLPTKEQLAAMDEFVDALDLMNVEQAEQGNSIPWYRPEAAFNPAIHRIKQAIFHSAVVHDINTNPLPPPHPDLLYYLDPPAEVVESKKARKALLKAKETFGVKKVERKVVKKEKEGRTYARDEDEELLLDKKGKSNGGARERKSPMKASQSQRNLGRASQTALKITGNDSGSETEEDVASDEEELLLNKSKTPAKDKQQSKALPTPGRSVSPQTDTGRVPGRIIGTMDPLADFKANLARGDVVSKAVEDMGWVIGEVVMKPFGGRRGGEALQWMRELRKVCLEEDEVDAWNAFLQDLKSKCLSKHGNPAFWKSVEGVGRELSLISDKEARKKGGVSQYTERQAEQFVGKGDDSWAF